MNGVSVGKILLRRNMLHYSGRRKLHWEGGGRRWLTYPCAGCFLPPRVLGLLPNVTGKNKHDKPSNSSWPDSKREKRRNVSSAADSVSMPLWYWQKIIRYITGAEAAFNLLNDEELGSSSLWNSQRKNAIFPAKKKNTFYKEQTPKQVASYLERSKTFRKKGLYISMKPAFRRRCIANMQQ